MGDFFNYDDRVFDIIDKNKELMRMKGMIDNILKSPEIKKILEKASKGGFGLDDDDKDFSKMIVDNNYEINTILDAYMQEISVRERPPPPRDLVLDSARRSIGKKELGLLEEVGNVDVPPRFSQDTSRSVTLDSLDLPSEKDTKRERTSVFIGEGEGERERDPELERQRATELVTRSAAAAAAAARESASENEERAKKLEAAAQDLLPKGARTPSTKVEGETEQALLEEQESAQRLEPTQAETDPPPEEPGVPEEQAGRRSETTTVVTASGFKKPPAQTVPYRRAGLGRRLRRGQEEEPEQPSVTPAVSETSGREKSDGG